MTAKQEIEVYSDGSVTKDSTPFLGVGWIVAVNGRIKRRESAPLSNVNLPDYEQYRIDIAEISAAIIALNSVDAGTAIKLHTDALCVERFFNDDDFCRAVLREPDVAGYYQGLSKAFNRHTILSVNLVHDYNNRKMHEAHRLAKAATRQQRFGPGNHTDHDVPAWPPRLAPDAFDCN